MPSLAGAAFLRRRELVAVVGAVEAAGGEARVVGGAVRSALIGRRPGDVDLATTLLPQAVTAAARAAGLKAVPTGIEHGTVTVVANGHPVEVTTLRKDVETDGRRAVVAFTTDWAVDAGRRDFTMNALYAGLDGTLHDPVGGYPDLRARHVRFIGDAKTRIREDYLRILRFFRFHAELGRGAPDAAGLAASVALAAGLERISAERIRAELLRLLAAGGAPATVAAMEAGGLFRALGLEAVDAGRMVRLAAIERALRRRPDPLLRLAALTLGPGSDPAAVAAGLRLSNGERDRLTAAAAHAGAIHPGLGGAALRALRYRIGPGTVRDAVLLAWASSGDDAASRRWRALQGEAERLAATGLPVRGRDLLAIGFAPGPALGEALAALEAAWVASDFTGSKDELLKMAGTILERRPAGEGEAPR